MTKNNFDFSSDENNGDSQRFKQLNVINQFKRAQRVNSFYNILYYKRIKKLCLLNLFQSTEKWSLVELLEHVDIREEDYLTFGKIWRELGSKDKAASFRQHVSYNDHPYIFNI